MKTILTLAMATLVTGSAFAAPMSYKLDTAASKVVWIGKKVTGEHTGNVTAKTGTITADGQMITGGDVVIDMKTITCTDLTDKEYNAKFIGHITTADFFDVQKYPESKLVIKSVKKTDKGQEITGDFTMMGQTHPLTFTATEVKADDKMVSAKANIEIDRTVWGLKYGSGKFFKGLGDKMINDKFTMNVDIKAMK